MLGQGKTLRWLKILGFLYFTFNCLIFITIFILAVSTSRDYQQFFSSALLSLFPGIGMLSGYWIRTGKFGWARSIVIAASLIISAVYLYIAFVVGPQLDTLKAEKFAQTQTHLKILSVRYRQRAVREDTREEVKALDHRLRELQQTLHENTALTEHLASQWTLYETLKDFSLAAKKADLDHGTLTYTMEYDKNMQIHSNSEK